MRTSLIETEQLDKYLHQSAESSEALLTEAKLMLSPTLRDKLYWQANTHDLIHLYGREKLRKEINAIENRLFTKPKYRSFQERISAIFKQ